MPGLPVFCPRQIIFTIPGNPAVQVTATERDGKIDFVVDVLDTTKSTGDLRALFFHMNEAKLGGLIFTGGDGYLTQTKVSANNVIDMGSGANLNGAVKAKFDVGLEWGTPGGAKDDINFAVHFTMDNAAHNLTLDDIAGQLFGARIDSVGGPGGPRNGATKLLGLAPAAPDAHDDVFSLFEDGVAGLNLPSKTPIAVTLNVLANDTDADTPASDFRITAFDAGPAHGTVTIAANGLSVLYTPNLDYAGTDTFTYCMTDGHGGQDHAVVNLTVVAVADDPVITFSVAQGATINETLITVTATQNDSDGSEHVDKIDWSVTGGLPAGATITPGLVDPTGTPNHITQQYVVTTAPGTDVNFGIDFTATAREASNGDTEAATGIQTIVIDYTHRFDTLTYSVADQSIWSNGPEFFFAYNKFLGIDDSWSDSYRLEILGVDTGTGYDVGLSLKAGFAVDVLFQGGQIDATIPVDLTLNTTFNKTTDNVFIESLLALGAGGSFATTGPEGHFYLDFIFRAAAHAFAEVLGVDLIDETINIDFSQPIFHFSSSDGPTNFPLFGGIFDITLEWPHISVHNDPGLLSGSGSSNNFLELALDIDALAAQFFPVLHILDTDPTDPDNFELLDLDLVGGINFIQNFALALASQSVDVVLEDGTHFSMTLGSGLMINNASAHDANHDGIISFGFDLSPHVTLNNDTELGFNLSAQLTVLKNFDVIDPIVDESLDIASFEIPVFNNTFDLNGVGSQHYDFFI